MYSIDRLPACDVDSFATGVFTDRSGENHHIATRAVLAVGDDGGAG